MHRSDGPRRESASVVVDALADGHPPRPRNPRVAATPFHERESQPRRRHRTRPAPNLPCPLASASLTVNDLRRSLAWYRDVVGFVVDQEHERGGTLQAVSLKAGDVRILITQDDGAKGFDRVKGEGFSLMLTTAQSVDDVARRIIDRGGTLDSQPADMPWERASSEFETRTDSSW
jgi:uncharacterized glyoxalase superfamily protein PhnB